MARLFNQTTLTGIGSLVLSIVPYFQLGAQMNNHAGTGDK